MLLDLKLWMPAGRRHSQSWNSKFQVKKTSVGSVTAPVILPFRNKRTHAMLEATETCRRQANLDAGVAGSKIPVPWRLKAAKRFPPRLQTPVVAQRRTSFNSVCTRQKLAQRSNELTCWCVVDDFPWLPELRITSSYSLPRRQGSLALSCSYIHVVHFTQINGAQNGGRE